MVNEDATKSWVCILDSARAGALLWSRVVRRPSSVVVHFSRLTSSLKPQNRIWRNLTGANPRHLRSLRFSGRSENQDGRPTSDRLRLLFNFSATAEQNSTKRHNKQDLSVSLPSLCFLRADPKTRTAALSLIGLDVFEFSFTTTERNSTKLHRKQYLNVLGHVCVFRTDRKNKMAARPLIDWYTIDFSSTTAKLNSTKHDRKQDLNVLCQIYVLADRKRSCHDLYCLCPELGSNFLACVHGTSTLRSCYLKTPTLSTTLNSILVENWLYTCNQQQPSNSILVIRSVTDVLRTKSRFVKFVGVTPQAAPPPPPPGRRPNPLHILQSYFGSEVRQ